MASCRRRKWSIASSAAASPRSGSSLNRKSSTKSTSRKRTHRRGWTRRTSNSQGLPRYSNDWIVQKVHGPREISDLPPLHIRRLGKCAAPVSIAIDQRCRRSRSLHLSRPEADAGLFRRASKRAVLASHHESSPLRQFQVGGVIDRQVVFSSELG